MPLLAREVNPAGGAALAGCSIDAHSLASNRILDRFTCQQLHLIAVSGDSSDALSWLRAQFTSLGGSIYERCQEQHVSGQFPSELLLIGSGDLFRSLMQRISTQPAVLHPLSATLGRIFAPESACTAHWQLAERTLNFSRRPGIMGILNVTPDSFSDGRRYLDPEAALDRAFALQEEGADILDIGGESTRPDAEPVPVVEELARVIPIISRLAGRLSIPISIDTHKAEVAEQALVAGAEIVNDISGLHFDQRMAQVVSAHRAGLVAMHTRGRPTEMQKNTRYCSLMGEVSQSLHASLQRASDAGIRTESVVLDPGIGFGKDLQGNLQIIRQLPELLSLGRPILLGPSRKSFIGSILARELHQRTFGTAATVAAAVLNGATLLRVHEVREMRDVAYMAAELRT